MAKRIKNVNGVEIELTDKEQSELEKQEKAWENEKAERELDELRLKRNMLISETDYLALSDVTMSDAWKNYRQELRDITKTFKSMSDKDFKFPDKPKS